MIAQRFNRRDQALAALAVVLARWLRDTGTQVIDTVRLRTAERLEGLRTEGNVRIALRELAARCWLAPGQIIPDPRDFRTPMPSRVRVHPDLREMF